MGETLRLAKARGQNVLRVTAEAETVLPGQPVSRNRQAFRVRSVLASQRKEPSAKLLMESLAVPPTKLLLLPAAA
jgi:hypothetical protein